eukprot:CAMPEP_0198145316 /NCGR_PEP_ID=MMETSP1443-20131203/22691_1 /TAXON_ID=186043 /ORGANISM="Entomoneis sp., Strain CCMP2396" /LENGTH=303 /DNA_ID=CAMNT_0043808923 /DNA_START=56 /DNA_END=967 /DNA_ORIENTATION=+
MTGTTRAMAAASSKVIKPILVTGANKGIGRAICSKLLSDYPEAVVLLASRNSVRGDQTIEDLKKELGDEVESRLHAITLDTSSDDSVKAAVEQVKSALGSHGGKLYGICNNAGVMGGVGFEEMLNVNYFGPQRINEAFFGMLQQPGGRIVNIASGSAPWFVQECQNAQLQKALTEPWTIEGGISEFNSMVKYFEANEAHEYHRQLLYGFTKASLNAYTWLLANQYKHTKINSVTPGWIVTDMTVGQGARNSPSMGAIPPVYLLMDEEVAKKPTGRYYGSDCKRSPFHLYRDPGSAEYDGPEGP